MSFIACRGNHRQFLAATLAILENLVAFDASAYALPARNAHVLPVAGRDTTLHLSNRTVVQSYGHRNFQIRPL